MDVINLYFAAVFWVCCAWTGARGEGIEAFPKELEDVKVGQKVELTCRISTNLTENIIWRLHDGTNCMACRTPSDKHVYPGACTDDTERFPPAESSCTVDKEWLQSKVTVVLTDQDIREWFCVAENLPISASVLLDGGQGMGGLLVGGIFASVFLVAVIAFVSVILYKTRDPDKEFDDVEAIVSHEHINYGCVPHETDTKLAISTIDTASKL